MANVVDPNYTVLCRVRKEWLPSTTVIGGLHAELKDVGAACLAERR